MPPNAKVTDPNAKVTDLRKSLDGAGREAATWRNRYEQVASENRDLKAKLAAAIQLTTEIADIAICESEAVAQKLRGIVGYPDGPCPPIEVLPQ